jgi:hypothetical protein
VGGLLQVCVWNSFKNTLYNRPTVLPKTLCLQFYITSEDTLSAVLHFFRRHFVSSSVALYGIWSGVLHFFRRHLVYIFIFLHDTLSGVFHFFRRHILHTSTFLHGHPFISHVMMHYSTLNDAVWTSVVIWHRMIWDSAFCLWMWKDRPQEGIVSVAKCYCDIRLKEMKEITKPSTRTVNSHRRLEGTYLRSVGKYRPIGTTCIH